MGFGLNLGGSKSSAKQNVFGGDQFKQYYDNMNSMFDSTMGNASEMGDQAASLSPFFQQLMQQGAGGADSLLQGGAAGGREDEILQQLMESFRSTSGGSKMGDMYKSIVGGEGNTYIDPMVSAMKRGSMENLDMMTSDNAMDASLAGQGGSSRHAMTDAMTKRGVNRDMLDRETMMRGGAYDKDLAMKMSIAEMADTNVGGTQDRLMSLLGSTDQNKMGGLSALQGLGGLGMQSMNPAMMSMMAPYYAMMMQGQGMGDPTVLSKQSGKSMSGGFSL